MDLTMPDPTTPTLLRSMMRHCVVDVSCGGAHTLLVTNTGSLLIPSLAARG
jgi:alpha-tubulin suppressor-like RCC1 family protein